MDTGVIPAQPGVWCAGRSRDAFAMFWRHETKPGPCTGRTMSSMSEQNGSAPAEVTPDAADEPCVDCASNGEKVLAVLGLVFGLLVIVMALDMFSGGKVTGYVTQNKAPSD